MRYYKTVLILFALAFIVVMVTSGQCVTPKEYNTDILDHLWTLRRGGDNCIWIPKSLEMLCVDLAHVLFGMPYWWDDVDWDSYLIRPIGW